MKYTRLILICSVCFSPLIHKLAAQVGAQGGANLNNNNVVGWNNIPTNLTKENVDYADVKGSCFWNQDWLRARVVMKNGQAYDVAKAKLNLYSKEIHYINEAGDERAVRNGVNSIIFYSPTDTTKIGVFKNLSGLFVNDKEIYLNHKEAYAQILTNGKTQLLKITTVKLIKRETDPFLNRPELIFEPREAYFIEERGNIKELKSISKGHLFQVIKKEDGDEDWLNAQKNKLRNENEVISFLTYRNSLANTTP